MSATLATAQNTVGSPGPVTAATHSGSDRAEGGSGGGGDDLVQLVYLSSAQHLLSKDELLAILTVSRRNNTSNDISGLLLYHDGNFIQFLEGARPKVDELYARISADGRHRGVLHLLKRSIDRRDFPSWTMGFQDLTDREAAEIDGLNDMMLSLTTPTPIDPNMSRAVQRLIASYRQLWDHGGAQKRASSY